MPVDKRQSAPAASRWHVYEETCLDNDLKITIVASLRRYKFEDSLSCMSLTITCRNEREVGWRDQRWKKERRTSWRLRSLSLIVPNTLLSTRLVHVLPTSPVSVVKVPPPSPPPSPVPEEEGSSTLTIDIDFLGSCPDEAPGAMILEISPENRPPLCWDWCVVIEEERA